MIKEVFIVREVKLYVGHKHYFVSGWDIKGESRR